MGKKKVKIFYKSIFLHAFCIIDIDTFHFILHVFSYVFTQLIEGGAQHNVA